jgi:guanylate kinase
MTFQSRGCSYREHYIKDIAIFKICGNVEKTYFFMANESKLWIFCIAGGSGAGKTTVVEKLLAKYPELTYFSVSATTRPIGNGEEHGKNYFYYDEETFVEMEQKGLFIETNPFATGSRYGTLLSELEKARSQGKVLIVDCEVNGALSIFSKYGDNVKGLFMDVSDAEAAVRLSKSSTRKREMIPKRIKNLQEQRVAAKKSEKFSQIFDTTGISEQIVFSVAEALFIEMYYAGIAV